MRVLFCVGVYAVFVYASDWVHCMRERDVISNISASIMFEL